MQCFEVRSPFGKSQLVWKWKPPSCKIQIGRDAKLFEVDGEVIGIKLTIEMPEWRVTAVGTKGE